MRRAVTLLKYGNSFIPVAKWFFSESSKFYFYSALSPPHNPYPISLLGINSRIKTGITRGLQDLPYQLLKLIYLLLFANFVFYIYFVITPLYNLEAAGLTIPLHSQLNPRTESQIATFSLLF